MDKITRISLVITENPDEILGDENQVAELYTVVSKDANAIISREMEEIVMAIANAKNDERLKPLGEKIENELKSNIISPLKNFVKGLLKNIAQEPVAQPAMGLNDTQVPEPVSAFGESTIIESLLLEALKLGIPRGAITKLYAKFKDAIESATNQIGEKIELHFDRFKDVPDKTKEKIRDGLERALIPSRNLAKRLGAAITKLGAGAHLGKEQTGQAQRTFSSETQRNAAEWIEKVKGWAEKVDLDTAGKAILSFRKHFHDMHAKAQEAMEAGDKSRKTHQLYSLSNYYSTALNDTWEEMLARRDQER